ncbi:uncharacterized protein LOC128667670 [Microplitis demolitor]|uniref:uncharacterized protein LOC128667670 n=1 Tax=Microplitis demolitor TaxID=69319 RepID=UPI00235B5BA0|nr:uncharacterized protein LOC128667670 [Microplitis demolitor]
MSSQYHQKFRNCWLQDPLLKDWLQSIDSTAGKLAKCTMCGITLRNYYADLKSHASTKKHQENSKLITIQSKLPFKPVDTKISKIKEARFSLFTAMHTSLRVIDHLGEVVNHSLTNEQDKIKLHRTQCLKIIMNIWAPHFLQILRNDLKDQPYSLLIDESTDITVIKNLGIIVIYYINNYKKIVSTYLTLVPIVDCDANGIISAIKDTLKQFNLSLTNMMGIGTDNASVITGINEGVHAKLKKEVPHLILVRCICHSLQLAISSAAKQFLPRNLEYIISETYNWFSRSASRQAKYKDFYKTINDGQDPLKIVQSSQTRWLSIESAVSRIYNQWLELKTHFSIVKLDERCYVAEVLHGMYNNDINYVFLAFLW